MISYDRFKEITEDELTLLPDYVYEELNGGVLVEERDYPHPARLADDLYILGTYSTRPIFGKQICLYYGSFLATMPGASEETVRKQIRDTVRHEFLHHLETRAGLTGKDTLIEEDRERMLTYFLKHRPAE